MEDYKFWQWKSKNPGAKSRFEKESESLGRMIRGETVHYWEKAKRWWTEEDKEAAARAEQVSKTFKQVCDVVLGGLIIGFAVLASLAVAGPLFLVGTIVGAFVWNFFENKEDN